MSLRNSSTIFHVLIGSFPERISVIAFVSDNLKGGEGQTLLLVSISRAARCNEMLHTERWSHFLRRLKESRSNVLSIYFCCLIYLCFVLILLYFLLLAGSGVRLGNDTEISLQEIPSCNLIVVQILEKMRCGQCSLDIIIARFKGRFVKKQITYHLDK